jgi:PAS domain S-box-containing protein
MASHNEVEQLKECIAALERSLGTYRLIVETTPSGICITDADNRITFVNVHWEQMLGYQPGELLGRSVFEILDGETHTLARAHQERRRQGAKDVGGELRIKRKDGSPLWVRFNSNRIVHPDGNVGAIALLQDISSEKQAQETQASLQSQVILAGRMASVGTLAAGVAHEINNPLAYVISNLEVVAEELREMAEDSVSQRLLEMIELVGEARQGAERVRKVVRGLKTFSRADTDRPISLDVRDVLEVSINMATNEMRHRARLVRDYRAVPRVEADEAKLCQVFMNLMLNAAQAIPEGQVDHNEIRLSTLEDDQGCVVIEVSDTGHGMSPDVLGRIFDPFFTTKALNAGTGLGLSICHGIVTALGGSITAHSEPGRGASFRVTLPPATIAEVAPSALSTAMPVVDRQGRILIVDDDAKVGSAIGRALRDHHVTVLTGAREGLELLARGERYDVILCDLMMPNMTGMDFHAEILRLYPQQAGCMVFVTGGAFTPTARAFLDSVPNRCLEKPFDSKSLKALVLRRVRARPA